MVKDLYVQMVAVGICLFSHTRNIYESRTWYLAYIAVRSIMVCLLQRTSADVSFCNV